MCSGSYVPTEMVSVRIQAGANQKLQKSHFWEQKRFLSKACSHFLRIPSVFQDMFVFAGLSLLIHSEVHSWTGTSQAMNYWCPFSRADVGSRWCIALGLAGDAKLNFNVSEQLNDWGLIHRHTLVTGLKIPKLGSHKLCRAAALWEGAAFSALIPWANLNTEVWIWYLCLFSRSHFSLSIVL